MYLYLYSLVRARPLDEESVWLTRKLWVARCQGKESRDLGDSTEAISILKRHVGMKMKLAYSPHRAARPMPQSCLYA